MISVDKIIEVVIAGIVVAIILKYMLNKEETI